MEQKTHNESVQEHNLDEKYLDLMGGYTKLNYKKLHDVYFSSHIIKLIRSRTMGGARGTHGREDKFVQSCGGRPLRMETA